MTFPDAKEMLTILLAEDDEGHAELVLGSLREAGVKNPMQRFRDGQELMEFLEGVMGSMSLEPSRPYVLLLDVRMPRMDGLEVLRRLKEDPVMRTLPVIMLTTTDDPREVEACYRLGCNGYVVKPVGYDSFSETLHRLGLFLSVLRVAKTPLQGGLA